MPSGTSCSDGRGHAWFFPVLYWKDLRRFWPLWALYLVIWLLVLPLGILVDRPGNSTGAIISTIGPGVFMPAVFGLLAAMAVFSYLYSPRSAVTFHALPVRREGLFLTNWLAGLSFLVLPNLAVTLLTALAVLCTGNTPPALALLLWFLSLSLMGLFFFSFAAFCAMFTGHLLALPVFYGILNFLVLGLAFLLELLADNLLFGFTFYSFPEEGVFWFTPVANLLRSVYYDNRGDGAGPLQGFGCILFYAAVGAAFSLLALAVYRRRHIETAGDVVSVPWVKPIFKYGVAVCSALSLGTGLCALIFGGLSPSPWRLLGFLVFWGLVGYFGAEMLLRKSFRVFKRSWKGAVALTAVFALTCCGLEFDVLGLERRVPAAGEVASAYVDLYYTAGSGRYSFSYVSLHLEDEEDLEALLALHASVADRREELRQYGSFYDAEAAAGADGAARLTIRYTLKYGSSAREYSLPIFASDLKDPASPAAQLDALINRPDLVLNSYFYGIPEDARVIDAYLSNYDTTYDKSTEVSAAGLASLLDAARRDISAGRLGRRYLVNSQEFWDTCYTSSLCLTLRCPADGGSYSITEISIPLQTTAADTLAELERLGLLGGGYTLRTYGELIS